MTQARQVEILHFRRGDDTATIAVGEEMVVTEIIYSEHCKEHKTLRQAIAYLEAKGYSIDNDNYKALI